MKCLVLAIMILSNYVEVTPSRICLLGFNNYLAKNARSLELTEAGCKQKGVIIIASNAHHTQLLSFAILYFYTRSKSEFKQLFLWTCKIWLQISHP